MIASHRAEALRICDRLRQQYSTRAPLPRCDGRHVYPCEEVKTGRCVCVASDVLSLQLLQRLFRAVAGEFWEGVQ